MKAPRTIITAAAALLGASTLTPVAQAAPADCTQGSAQTAIHAGLIGSKHLREGKTRTGPATAAAECRYTLYNDGATYTFSDDDVFAGVTAFTWWDWETDGYTRAEITEIIMAENYTVRLAEVQPDGSLGPFVELDLDQTPVKYHVFDGQGLTAYQVTGVVLDLDPGTYVTKFTQSSPYWPGEDYEAAVTLVVTG
jgi:hypothetical protein